MNAKGYRLNDSVRLYPGGAALLTEENTLVIADLHLGCEAALEYEGLSLPRVQTKKIEQYLDAIIKALEPSRVIVAGDLKHNFSRNLVQEWNDVARFVQVLSKRTPLEVVKGNHDNYLASILSDYNVPMGVETFVGGIRIMHGHRGTPKDVPTIIGHLHPSLRLRDRVGASTKDPCFLYHPGSRMLILPALSIVAYGLDVVHQPSSDSASPLLPEDGLSQFVPIVFSKDKALRFPTVGELRAVR